MSSEPPETELREMGVIDWESVPTGAPGGDESFPIEISASHYHGGGIPNGARCRCHECGYLGTAGSNKYYDDGGRLLCEDCLQKRKDAVKKSDEPGSLEATKRADAKIPNGHWKALMRKLAGNARQRHAIYEVLLERFKRHEKWGEQNHDDLRWFAILAEEVGEVAKGALDRPYSCGLRDDIINVAAVAVAWLECLERREGK